MTNQRALVEQARSSGVLALLDTDNPFVQLADAAGSGGEILKFSGNTGEFTYKGTVFEHGTQLVFNMANSMHGYVCWKGGKLIDRHFTPIISREPVPAISDLPDHGPYKESEGWKDAFMVKVFDMETQTELEHTVSNISGCNAMRALIKDFGSKVRLNVDETGMPKSPIVEISANSFESPKSPTKKWAPAYKIQDWISIAEMDAYLNIEENTAAQAKVEASIAAERADDAAEAAALAELEAKKAAEAVKAKAQAAAAKPGAIRRPVSTKFQR